MIFNDEMNQIRRAQFLAIAALLCGSIALTLAVVKSTLQDINVSSKTNVACIPTDVDYSHPIVYRQSFTNPVKSDARLKTFVEQYVRLTKDEGIVNYHSVSNNQRYDRVKLSRSKWQAIEMSTGLEKQDQMRAYADSKDLFKLLSESGVGWKFLIDDIVIYGVPESGPVLATVRGQYQVTYDQAKRPDVPHQLFGYKELRYLIIQGAPTKDSNGNYLNKTGFFVSWAQEETVDPAVRERLSKERADIYLNSKVGE